MRRVILGLLGVLLAGCHDPDAIPRGVLQGFGETAEVDLAIHRRLRAIEAKLKITPPSSDTIQLDTLESEIERVKEAKRR